MKLKENKRIKRLRELEWSKIKKFIKFYLILFVIFIIIIMLLTTGIVIEIHWQERNISFVFTIANALVWYIYINLTGLFNKGIRKLSWKLILFAIFILLMLSGFGFFNLEFHFNFAWFFIYKTLSTASPDGIYFFFLNIYFWISVFFISKLLESESEVRDL